MITYGRIYKMKKLLGILVLGLLICSSNFAEVKSSELVNTIMKKNENFNLGIKKDDTTVNGVKLRISMAFSVGDFHQYKYEQNYNKDKN